MRRGDEERRGEELYLVFICRAIEDNRETKTNFCYVIFCLLLQFSEA